MTDVSLPDVLRESLQEVLEKMFFVTADESPRLIAGPEFIAHLRFAGMPSGCFTLRATEAAARYVAGDFLGEDAAALSVEKIGEVIGELCNMVCGSVLSRVESTTVFHLQTPIATFRGAGATGEAYPATATVYAAEIGQGILVAILQTEEQDA